MEAAGCDCAGAGEGLLLNVVRESLCMVRGVLSPGMVGSRRGDAGVEGGAGEVGRLEGRNREDGRRACIMSSGKGKM